MAKGQIKSNKEVRKPKKDAKSKTPVSSVQAAFAQPGGKMGGKKK